MCQRECCSDLWVPKQCSVISDIAALLTFGSCKLFGGGVTDRFSTNCDRLWTKMGDCYNCAAELIRLCELLFCPPGEFCPLLPLLLFSINRYWSSGWIDRFFQLLCTVIPWKLLKWRLPPANHDFPPQRPLRELDNDLAKVNCEQLLEIFM